MATTEEISGSSGNRVAEFFDWWFGELSAMTPRQRQRPPPRAIEIDGEDAVVKRVGRWGERELRRIDLAGATPAEIAFDRPPRSGPVLRLPMALALTRRLRLPRAAERKLDLILRHEFGSRIPYPIEDAYFDHLIVERNRGSIEVVLYCALREKVDALRAKLAAKRLSPSRVTIEGVDVDLLRRLREAGAQGGSKTIAILAGVAALALLAAVAWRPLEQRRQLIAALEFESEAARAAAAATLTLEDQVTAAREAQIALARQMARTTPRIVLIDEISRTLPDGAWLRRMDFEGDEIRLSGEAQQAAALIPLFEGSERFSNAIFASPVTVGRDGAERFDLKIEIAKGEGA